MTAEVMHSSTPNHSTSATRAIAIGIVFAIAGFWVSGTDLHAVDHGSTVRCGNPWDDLAHGDAAEMDQKNKLAVPSSQAAGQSGNPTYRQALRELTPLWCLTARVPSQPPGPG